MGVVDASLGVRARDIESIFNGDDNAKNLFQLMLYANLMNFHRGMDVPVKLAIYQISELAKNGETLPEMGRDAEPGKRVSYDRLHTHLERNDEFLAKTQEVLSEIFDKETPFEPVDDDAKCQYCNLAHLCGRSL